MHRTKRKPMEFMNYDLFRELVVGEQEDGFSLFEDSDLEEIEDFYESIFRYVDGEQIQEIRIHLDDDADDIEGFLTENLRHPHPELVKLATIDPDLNSKIYRNRFSYVDTPTGMVGYSMKYDAIFMDWPDSNQQMAILFNKDNEEFDA